MPAPADLPDDIAALKALIAERDAALAHKEVVVSELREQLSTRSAEIEHLKLWIAKLQRMQFGRKSEKLDSQIAQLELRLEDLQADEGEVRQPGAATEAAVPHPAAQAIAAAPATRRASAGPDRAGMPVLRRPSQAPG